jgi:hypothetical protein
VIEARLINQEEGRKAGKRSTMGIKRTMVSPAWSFLVSWLPHSRNEKVPTRARLEVGTLGQNG